MTSGNSGWNYSTALLTTDACNGTGGQYWHQDSNGEFHNSYWGNCLDGGDWRVCADTCYIWPFAYSNSCNGGDGYQEFTFGAKGPHPFQYIGYTIHAYGPWTAEYVLDVKGDGRANGTQVDIAPYNASPAQFWWYDPRTLEIHLTDSDNMCLDKPGGENANGTSLQIYTCNGGANQQWHQEALDLAYAGFQGTTYVQVADQVVWVNGESNTCLDTPMGNFNNPIVQMFTCNGNLNQTWIGPHADVP